MVEIVPGILTDSFEEAQSKLKKLEDLCNLVHIDVTDGRFVPNLTIQAGEIARLETNLPFNLHLMIYTENNQIFAFGKTAAASLIFYPKTTQNPQTVISIIKSHGKKVGIAFDPEDQVEEQSQLLTQADLALVLGVTPGFVGQKLIPQVLSKIPQIKEIAPQLKVGVDGGVNLQDVKMIVQAGVDFVVSASFIWGQDNPAKAIEILKKEVE